VVDAAGEIYGDVTNIALRVQALAEPSAVLITSEANDGSDEGQAGGRGISGLTARDALCLLVGCMLTVLDEAPTDEESRHTTSGSGASRTSSTDISDGNDRS
jgi:hypothetical protein